MWFQIKTSFAEIESFRGWIFALAFTMSAQSEVVVKSGDVSHTDSERKLTASHGIIDHEGREFVGE